MKVRNSIFGIIALVTLCVIGCKKDPLFDTTEITTKQVTSITGSSAVSGGEITSDGFPTISKRGVCYGTSHEPTMNDMTAIHPNGGLGGFSVTMTDLLENTTYYVRAFAWNSTGAIYGEEYSFTTPYKPILSTLEAEEVTSVSAVCGGNITDDGNADISQRGLCWSTHENPTIEDSTSVVDSVGIGTFKSEMTKLTPGTLYYVRAYGTNAAGTAYGDVQQFTTQNVPVLKATEFANVTQETVVCSGSILDNAGADVTEQGFCWSTTSQPTIENEKITATAENGLGDFSITLSGLQWGTTYYVRSYATNSVGTAYGDEVSFTTWNVTTNIPTNITDNSADCGGTIVAESKTDFIEKGLCWSNSINPTIENEKLILNGENFSGTITGLTDGVVYYVRAYATNAVGTMYGEEQTFTTLTVPTVETYNAENVSYTTATAKAKVVADGGATVTERGFCYSTSNTNPTLSDSKITVGNGTSNFNYSFTGLTDNTTYYIRPYATNSVGTAYGSTINFTTTEITAPTVAATTATNVSYTSVTLGGNVTNENGATVTERGVCYGTSANPTINDNKVTAENGTGTFTVSVADLADGVTFYARAYAVNERGITYGEAISYTTTKITAPTVITTDVQNVTYSTVTLGGKITDENGAIVTECGICWSTNKTPTISNSKKVVENKIGDYTIKLTGLDSDITYYACAYATNAKGTSYGAIVSFTTTITGAIYGIFSVSKDKKICFSQGNLQYQASTNIWRFAEHQWDFIGTHKSETPRYNQGTVIGSDNMDKSSTYNGWIDYFGWGTSGYNDKEPYRDTYAEGNKDIVGTNYDWGVYNAISNGGNQIGLWRTLSKEEWDYIINLRTNASSKIGEATVNNVKGMILLPDNWILPNGVSFQNKFSNDYYCSESYKTVNNYSLSDWAKMEANGAVFLPAAGGMGYDYLKDKFIVSSIMCFGGYHTSSVGKTYNTTYIIYFNGDDGIGLSNEKRSGHKPVRLVRDYLE